MGITKNINIAFLGCGVIAQAHWRSIQTHAPELKVTAVIDIDTSKAVAMADATGAQVYDTLEAALDQGDFEAVDIMLPHNMHEQAAILAFQAGKHVILEKPMSTTLDSCDRILTAAREAGTVFMVAEQSQYSPSSGQTQQLIQNGAIGEVVTARAAFGGQVEKGWSSASWRYNKEVTGGGICIDGGQHWIRPLTDVVGRNR